MTLLVEFAGAGYGPAELLHFQTIDKTFDFL